jgi:type II secretory pathway component PulK
LGPEIAACIIDWRDADDVELEGGAEKEHYSSLDRPYKCKNAPFTVPEELRLVKGVTGDVFEKMKGFVTVYGDGKVNVNTAPREVLVALGMTEDLADRIIAYRNGADAKPGTSDDGVFRDVNIEVALKDLSASEGAVVASLKNSFTTKSGYFRIESLGTVRSKVKRTFISVVKKGEGKCQSVSFREY